MKLSWLSRLSRFERDLREFERRLAKKGGGWDGLELGGWYRAYVVAVPEEGELTPEGRPKLPSCRLKDRDGHFIGRFMVTDVDKPVELGQELAVFVTAVSARVVFATAGTEK